jgi:hypothetical protein
VEFKNLIADLPDLMPRGSNKLTEPVIQERSCPVSRFNIDRLKTVCVARQSLFT